MPLNYCDYCDKQFERKFGRDFFCSVECRKKNLTKNLDRKAIAELSRSGWGMQPIAAKFNVPTSQIQSCLKLESVQIRHKKFAGRNVCSYCQKKFNNGRVGYFCSSTCHDLDLSKRLDVNAIAESYARTKSKFKTAAEFKTSSYRVGAALRVKDRQNSINSKANA